MLAVLRLEWVGASQDVELRDADRLLASLLPPHRRGAPAKLTRRPWVAWVTGAYASGKFSRQFVNGATDHGGSNSQGSRGVVVTFICESGRVYEVFANHGWRQTELYYCRFAEDGRCLRMTKAEVFDWLAIVDKVWP